MDQVIQEILMMASMVLVYILGLINDDMRENGETVKCMETESFHGQTEDDTRDLM